MSFETFGKDNLNMALKELGKEYRKLVGKHMPAEIILIGGAAVLENYGFREMTTDIDAVILASSAMRDAINHVGDRLHLPNGWLNDDFKKTDSYSPHLAEVSVYCKTYYGALNVRTVSAEYLVAMKLKAGRKYKNDLSDVVGILAEHKRNGTELAEEQILAAAEKLYGRADALPEESRVFLSDLIGRGNYEEIYEEIRSGESSAKDVLLEFQEAYPEVLKTDNADEILKTLRARKAAQEKSK